MKYLVLIIAGVVIASCSAGLIKPEAQPQPMAVRSAVLAPPSPIGLAARSYSEAISATQSEPNLGLATLEWLPSDLATDYAVYYWLNPAEKQYIKTSGKTKITIKNLVEGSEYSFYCVSYDQTGKESLPSQIVRLKIPVYTSIRTDRLVIESRGVVSRTNLIQLSTNLTDWVTIKTFTGNNQINSILHTNNQPMVWFRTVTK